MSSIIGADLRRGIIVRSKKQGSGVTAKVAQAASVELLNAGFLISAKALAGFTHDEVVELVNSAKAVAGADRNWRPVYPGFPKQVRETPVTTLIAEQIAHYESGGTILPEFADVEYKKLPWMDSLRNAKPLKVETNKAALQQRVMAIVTDKVAMSESDAEFLRTLVFESGLTVEQGVAIAAQSVNQENVQRLVRAFDGIADRSELFDGFVEVARTPDSLLRLVYAIFGGSVNEDHFSAAAYNLTSGSDWAIRFANMPKKSKRALMRRLGRVSRGYNADNLVARKHQWQHLMRMIHPFSLTLDDESKRAADIIHENVEYRTLNAEVEAAIAKRNVKKVVELLSENRPSDLVRRMVALAHLGRGQKALAEAVVRVANRVPLTTLISAWEGVVNAGTTGAKVTRVAGGRNQVRSGEGKVLSEKNVKLLREGIEDAIKVKLADKSVAGFTGNVGVKSEEPVSLVQRDLSASDRSLFRGQRVGVAGNATLRFFQHWKNDQSNSGYVDLGVIIADEDFQQLTNVSWNSYSDSHGEGGWSAYSGDTCVSPGESAVEFIDVDIAGALKAHPTAKWAITTLASYSGWKFDDLDVYAGVAYRERPDDAAPFDARSVISACNVSGNGTSNVVCATNLLTGETVWVDTCTGGMSSGHTAGSDGSLTEVAQFEVGRERFTYGRLAQLWAQSQTLPMAFSEEANIEFLRSLL